MPVAPARPIAPTAAERERLKKLAYGHKTEYGLRVRAQVVLHASRGRPNARIGASLATISGFGFVEVGEQWDEEDGRELVFEVPARRIPLTRRDGSRHNTEP
ncbi:hypothetical protein [Streptomyces sp. I05A-00742]|uniref:hypothetical protein n=1 Tax=Streptomyces sp. I05A-00742 TaxID=2732853 RepID=UPI0014889C5A|nr:hypothetical protein [Streptomyces sp. I05A-00742]